MEEKNNKENSLHGGNKGFDKVCWKAEKIDEQSLKFSYLSEDGEEGFPGNLSVEVTYSLSPLNELIIQYSATTDQATPSPGRPSPTAAFCAWASMVLRQVLVLQEQAETAHWHWPAAFAASLASWI